MIPAVDEREKGELAEALGALQLKMSACLKKFGHAGTFDAAGNLQAGEEQLLEQPHEQQQEQEQEQLPEKQERVEEQELAELTTRPGSAPGRVETNLTKTMQMADGGDVELRMIAELGRAGKKLARGFSLRRIKKAKGEEEVVAEAAAAATLGFGKFAEPEHEEEEGQEEEEEHSGPSLSEVGSYAAHLGLDLRSQTDAEFVFLAEEALTAPLPFPWVERMKECTLDGGGGRTISIGEQVAYFNTETLEWMLHHPLEAHFAELIAELKRLKFELTFAVKAAAPLDELARMSEHTTEIMRNHTTRMAALHAQQERDERMHALGAGAEAGRPASREQDTSSRAEGAQESQRKRFQTGEAGLMRRRAAASAAGEAKQPQPLQTIHSERTLVFESPVSANNSFRPPSAGRPASAEALLRTAFDRADADGSGMIDREELAGLLANVGDDGFGLGGAELSERELDELMDMMDEDGNGEVDFEELTAFVRGGGFHGNRLMAHAVRRATGLQVRMEDDGRITLLDGEAFRDDAIFDDVSKMTTASDKLRLRERQEKYAGADPVLLKMFATIDKDQSGALDREEVGAALRGLGQHLDSAQLDAVMSEMDEDGNGVVDFEEFVMWYKDPSAGSQDIAARLATSAIEQATGYELKIGPDGLPYFPSGR